MRAAVAAAAFLALLGCEREKRRFKEISAVSRVGDPSARSPYQDNAWAVSEGKRLYLWFNCVGCHAHGGGGIGPPLMDRKWIYGSAPSEIYTSIVDGRPNGMPSFRGKIPDQQVWQLVAYVQSLGGFLRTDVAPGRDDSMSYKRNEQLEPKQQREQTEAPTR